MIKNIQSQKFILRTVVVAICASFASGCATDPKTGLPSFKETFASDDPCSQNARNIGVGIGVLAGALIGKQIDGSNKGLLVGAALGGAIGGLIGADIDKRRCELSKIAKQYNLDMQVSALDASGEIIGMANAETGANDAKKNAVGSVVEIRDVAGAGGHFETNSDQLTPKARLYFAAIANTYNAKKNAAQIQDPKLRAEYLVQLSNRKILLIGHTDDTGSSRVNADLSERRAKAVSKFMEDRGIARDSLYFQGAGEFYPVADNNTEGGRAKNRRVDIVELNDKANFDQYLVARKPRYDFYRAKDVAANVVTTQEIKSESRAEKIKAKQTTVERKSIVQTETVAMANTQTPSAKTSQTAALKMVVTGERFIDFGGTPISQATTFTSIGQLESKKSLFSLINTAYADEPAVVANCMQDRPRVANGVKALSDGKTYKTSEHIPGLYGKTWTDQVNGHQIVINKVAVLAGDGSLANPPEFKVYTNYDPAKSRTATPVLAMKPEVNTYRGSKGVLYRMFINGREGLECVDIVFENSGGIQAKAGRLAYTHEAKPYAADFRPKMYQ